MRKKTSTSTKKAILKNEISPEQALDFLENFRKMRAGQDDKTVAISLRVPENILTAFKTMAKFENNSYQRMIIQALRQFLIQKREMESSR